MNIAFVTAGYPSKGDTFITNQITGFIDRGHHIDIFSLKEEIHENYHEDFVKYGLTKKIKYYGKPHSRKKELMCLINDFLYNPFIFFRILFTSLNIAVFKKSSFTLSAYFLLRHFMIDKINYDIYFIHGGNVAKKMLFLKKYFPKSKFVVNFLGFDFSGYIRQFGTLVYKELFKKSDLVIAHSRFSYDCILSLGCDEKKIIIHPVGIYTNLFNLKSSYNTDGKIVFITVARLVEKKAHRIMISAFKLLSEEFKNFEYVIVGDGPLQNDIKFQIYEDGLSEIVKMKGHRTQEEVSALLKESDVFIQTSIASLRWADMEDTTTTLIEAQAVGLPVIASYHAGLSEVININKSGYVVPERNTVELYLAIKRIINERNRWKQMGSEGRKFIEDNFDIISLNNKLESIFSNLLCK